MPQLIVLNNKLHKLVYCDYFKSLKLKLKYISSSIGMLMSEMFDFKTIEVVDVKVSGAEGPCVGNVNIDMTFSIAHTW